jgi:predicted HNH restriction endonuclease
MEVHHVRKLGDLKGKEIWEQQLMQRKRKTMVLCEECHAQLHAGKLQVSKRKKAAS